MKYPKEIVTNRPPLAGHAVRLESPRTSLMADEDHDDFERTINDICNAQWEFATVEQLLNICHIYYYFSVQFRENLEIACQLYADDVNLKRLFKEECNTDNLSPWRGIARPAEKLDHDEFIHRALLLEPRRLHHIVLDEIGRHYLEKIRKIDLLSRVKSISSYENGGLQRVFLSILRAPRWDGPILEAFRFFLLKHVEFDSRAEGGHGSLCRHLVPDCSVAPVWRAFKDLLGAAVPEILCAGTSLKIDSLASVTNGLRCVERSAAGCEDGDRNPPMIPSASA